MAYPSIRSIEGSAPEKIRRLIAPRAGDVGSGGQTAPTSPISRNQFVRSASYRDAFRSYVNAAKNYIQRSTGQGTGLGSVQRQIGGPNLEQAIRQLQGPEERTVRPLMMMNDERSFDPMSDYEYIQSIRRRLQRRNEAYDPGQGLYREDADNFVPAPSLAPVDWYPQGD